METARYRAFVTSANTGSFSKAAQALKYTPSGVSQLVAALEKEVGFPLLGRTKKGVELTENGAQLLPLIQSLLTQEERIYEKAADMKGLLIGSVTIAAYSSIATHWLPAVIRAFEQDHPQIKINLMEGIRQEVTAWLDEGKADIGFLSFKESMPYEWQPLKEDEMLAVLPRIHPLAGNQFYPIRRCETDNVIMPALGKDDDVVSLFQKHGIVPNIRYTTLENFAAMAMVEQGLGISIMNELITRKRICDVTKLPLDPPASITLGLAAPSFKGLSPAGREFMRYAVRILR